MKPAVVLVRFSHHECGNPLYRAELRAGKKGRGRVIERAFFLDTERAWEVAESVLRAAAEREGYEIVGFIRSGCDI